MKKINPRNRPATQADVKKAKFVAVNQAIEFLLTLVLYLLKDKFGFDDEQLMRFNHLFQKNVDMINEGRLSLKDIRDILGDEYDLHIEVRNA